MPDALFADPRLAPLYDAFDGERDDLPPYLRIVEDLRASHVLDVGCGTPDRPGREHVFVARRQ